MVLTSYWRSTEVLRDTRTATITIPDDEEVIAMDGNKAHLLVITRRTKEKG